MFKDNVQYVQSIFQEYLKHQLDRQHLHFLTQMVLCVCNRSHNYMIVENAKVPGSKIQIKKVAFKKTKPYTALWKNEAQNKIQEENTFILAKYKCV